MVMMISREEAKGCTWLNYELVPCRCGTTHRVPFEEPAGEPLFKFNEGFCRYQAQWVADMRITLGFVPEDI